MKSGQFLVIQLGLGQYGIETAGWKKRVFLLNSFVGPWGPLRCIGYTEKNHGIALEMG